MFAINPSQCLNNLHFRSKLPTSPWYSNNQASLRRFPTEILCAVFQHVGDIHDVVCFCLVHQKLFLIGLARLLQLQKAKVAPWAGDRLICLSDYSNSTHLPAGILPYVRKELENREGSRFYRVIYDFYRKLLRLPSCGLYSTTNIEPRLDAAFTRKLVETGDYGPYKALLVPRFGSHMPWVISNVSRGEYIRAQSIPTDAGNEDAPHDRIRQLKLGHAVLYSIFWSHNSRNDSADSWAGDGFEISTIDGLRKNMVWVDVTERMLAGIPLSAV